MKYLIIFLSLTSFSIYSQVTSTKIEVREKEKEQLIYDGKSNFKEFEDIDGYKLYIGQKIYTLKSFSPIYNVKGQRFADYHNKYYTIKNVIQKKVNAYSNDMVVSDVLEIVSDENGKTYYYKIGKSYNSGAGWVNDGIQPSIILVPYFLNLKETYENKQYVIVSYWRENGFKNEATNEWVVVDEKLYGGKWNCEVSLIEKDGKEMICFIMKSNEGEVISSPVNNNANFKKFSIAKKLDDSVNGGLFFMSVEDYNDQVELRNKIKIDEVARNNDRIDKLTQKYGKQKGDLIADGKVEIGMTKEMCKEAWGIPLKTNVEKTSTITKESLIYSWSKRLHFQNGKLVKIEY